MAVTSLILAAGAGRRLTGTAPKGMRPLGGIPLYLHALGAFERAASVEGHVVVVPGGSEDAIRDEAASRASKPVVVIAGGPRRQDSVLLGLEAAAGAFAAASSPGTTAERLVAVHDAARPFVAHDLIERIVACARTSGACVPVLPATDTVREASAAGSAPRLLDRERISLAQTPQVGRLDWLLAAYRRARDERVEVTDEGAALERSGFAVAFVEGSRSNRKITTDEDLEEAEAFLALGGGDAPWRVGFGEDRHPRVESRPFILAGVVLDRSHGPAGHSDGDPLCHALVDALLGAAGAGTIGEMFPDTDPRWSGAPGLTLLEAAARRVSELGWRTLNVDCVVTTDTPRIAPHLPAIRRGLALALGTPEACVSVKGKRAEGLGFEGSGAGVACRAVVLLARARRP